MTSARAHCALSCAESTGQSLGMSMTSRRSQSLGGKLASHGSEETWDRAAASAAVASTASMGLPPAGQPSRYGLSRMSAHIRFWSSWYFRSNPHPFTQVASDRGPLCSHCPLCCRGAADVSSKEVEDRSDAGQGSMTVQPHAPVTAATPLPEPVLTSGRQPSKHGRPWVLYCIHYPVAFIKCFSIMACTV